MLKWFKKFSRHNEMQTTCKSETDLTDNGTVCITAKRDGDISFSEGKLFPFNMLNTPTIVPAFSSAIFLSFSGNKSKKELEAYINSKPDCKFISCARAKNSSGFILRFSCALSTVSATLPEECHIFIDKYNLSITELVKQ